MISNLLPGAMADMWDAAAAGESGIAPVPCTTRIQPLTRLLFVESNPIPVKAAMAMLGKIAPDIRLPLCPCSDQLKERLRAQLASEGLL